MKRDSTLESIWEQRRSAGQAFDAKLVEGLPLPARRYLQQAITQGTRLARSVRLRMRGEIRLRGFSPFEAEQVLSLDQGFVWRAKVKMKGLPVSGYDRLIDGRGELRWKLLGLFPIAKADGKDITRSAVGRMISELIWLPSAFCVPGVEIDAPSEERVRISMAVHDLPHTLELGVDSAGRVNELRIERWGNPEGGPFALHTFGGVVEEQRNFEGYTIPSRIAAGWHFGSERFERDGEFIRLIIDEAVYR